MLFVQLQFIIHTRSHLSLFSHLRSMLPGIGQTHDMIFIWKLWRKKDEGNFSSIENRLCFILLVRLYFRHGERTNKPTNISAGMGRTGWMCVAPCVHVTSIYRQILIFVKLCRMRWNDFVLLFFFFCGAFSRVFCCAFYAPFDFYYTNFGLRTQNAHHRNVAVLAAFRDVWIGILKFGRAYRVAQVNSGQTC